MSDLIDRVSGVIVVILGGGRGTRLEPLTRLRSKPAVPIAGKFRLIDIPISNCIHSQMNRVFLLTQYNSVSLHRHIVRTYKFDPFSRGFVQILAAQQTPTGERWFQGTADAVRQNLHIMTEMQGDDVLILSGDHMYRMDYREMLRDHVDRNADITLSVLPCSEEEVAGFGAVRVDESGRVVAFREKPATPEALEGMRIGEALREQRKLNPEKPYLASMGIYIFKKDMLARCLANDLTDFGKDIIPKAAEKFNVQAHFFKGYWRDIGTIGSFYQTHMDLLQDDPPFSFDDENWPFYTLPRYLPGSKLDSTSFTRTILSEGTHIVRSTIEHSIIGVAARLREATVRHALVMGTDAPVPSAPPDSPRVGIGPGTVIEKAIVDKNARIGRDVDISDRGSREEEAEGPGWAIRDGIVVISKNAVIPDGTKI